jgi:hypothetical protein
MNAPPCKYNVIAQEVKYATALLIPGYRVPGALQFPKYDVETPVLPV